MAIMDAIKGFMSGGSPTGTQARVTPISEMNALQKFGLVLQNTADPNYLPRYQQALIQDQERLKREQANKALQDYAMSANIPQHLQQVFAASPELLQQYVMQQNDPLRQAQLANAQMGLENTRAERQRASALAQLFGSAGGDTLPEGVQGAVRPPTAPRELLMQAAQIDPNQFGSVALKALAGGGGESPASVREYQYFQSLPPQQQEEYLRVKRSQQVIDFGGGFGSLDPRTGKVQPLIDKTLAPADLPATKAAQTLAVEDAKLQSELNKKASNSQNTLDIITTAEGLLPLATGSGVGALADIGKSVVGISDPQTQANKKLELLSGWMVSNVPRMEGPQSDFDVKNYKAMAADVGNSSLPVADRLAALEALKMIHNKYAGNNEGMPKDKPRIKFDAQGNIVE